MKNHQLFSLFFFLFLTCSCSVVPVKHIAGPSKSTLPPKLLKVDNDKILRESYCSELFLAEGFDATSGEKGLALPENKAIYRKAYQRCLEPLSGAASFPAPNLGLALSGGGTRSGSFSIGVLKALDDISKSDGESLLRQVDAISSVSGGGYAAYWYLMQNFYRDPVKENCCKDVTRNEINQVQKDIFRTRQDVSILGKKTIKYQNHLATTSDLIFAYQGSFAHWLEDGWNLAGQVFTIPFHWIINGVVDWPLNFSTAPLAYQQGIERTYGLATRKCYSPLLDKCQDANCKYYNARRGYFAWFNDEAQATRVSFGEYRDFLRIRNSRIHSHNADSSENYIHPLPLPIINTTQGFWNKKLDDIDDSVYTFTPLRYGSGLGDYLQDYDKPAKVSMSKAYGISGAAVDANARETGMLADFGLWFFNANLGYRYPNLNQNINRWSFNANRILHYLLPIGAYHLHNYLTPKDEYRPYYRLSDGGQSENLGFYSLIKRATRHVIVVDAEQDNDYQFDALRRLTKNVSREMGLEVTVDGLEQFGAAYKAGRNPKPAFSGKISGLQNPDKAGSPREIEFLYLKLALDKDRYAAVHKGTENACSTIPQIRSYKFDSEKKPPLPCSVVDFIRSEPKNKKYKFPHNSTADIFYDQAQFRAYRDFGYYLAMTELRPLLMRQNGMLADVEKYRTERFRFFNQLVSQAKASSGKAD